MDASGPARYLHLLSQEELRSLRPALTLLEASSERLLSRWYELYREAFGDRPTLAEPVFRELYRRDLSLLLRDLSVPDLAAFERDMTELGHALVDAGVSFAEVVASLHLLEESAGEQLRGQLEAFVFPRIVQLFDKVSHCRLILLASAYHGGREAEASARVQALEQETQRLAPDPALRAVFHGLVGASAAMRKVYDDIVAASIGQGTVLIAGESGTGKELVVRAIHELGATVGKPFVAVNCAALPRDLFESELFGHHRGAYTGAQDEHLGLIRLATGGIVFLDEVSEMPLEVQAKLLRVIEERKLRAVGALQEVAIDVRFVASTNRDPEQAMAAGVLRRDLYHRLAAFRIDLPPLRARVEDLPPLSDHFARLFAERGQRRVEGLAAEAVAAMAEYGWPGNVRELRNSIEHALAAGRGARIELEELPPQIQELAVTRGRPATQPPGRHIPTLEQSERELIRLALEATGGNKVQAARLLAISRHQLYDRLRALGLESAATH